MSDPISEAAGFEAFNEAWRAALSPWSRMPPEEWAEEIYRLPRGGRFSWAYAPYSREMFRAIWDRRNIETNFRLFSRGLKSTVVLLSIGYIMDQSPRDILSLWPSNDNAELWSKDNLCGELLDCVPALHYLGTRNKKRTAANTLLHKRFFGGKIQIFGANAPGDMRRAKGSFLYGDEIDAIKKTETDEGDQLLIFGKRGDEYPDTIRVFASYPSVKGHSRIDARIEESDYCEWWVHCLKCGDPFVMHRNQLQFDRNHTATARLQCPLCKTMHDDTARYAMAHLQGFENWKARNTFRGKRGFHGNSLLWPHPVDPVKYPGGYLQVLAEKIIGVETSEDRKRSLKVLMNTEDAESIDPTNDVEKPPDWEIIYRRREKYMKAPAAARVVTCMTDVQRNRLEIEWRAWAANEESWGLGHVILDGDTMKREIWEGDFTRAMQRTFEREDGATMKLNMGFIDGGWSGEMVYLYFQWLAKKGLLTGVLRGSKGVGKAGHVLVDRKWTTISKNLKGHNIGTWEAKEAINQKLNLSQMEDGDFPQGFMHYNESYGEEFFRQLCTGKATLTFEVVNGKMEEVKKYLNEEKLRDEGLDLAVGNLAAFRFRTWQFDSLEADLQATIPGAESKEEVMEVQSAGSMWGGAPSGW
jgi:phage terminase large subunit GpA-like protein